MNILKDFDILKFGNELQISGVLFSDGDNNVIATIPNSSGLKGAKIYEVNTEDWLTIIRQTDTLEVEMFEKVDGKLVKTIVRKTTRQIEQGVSWNVFRRDGYRCRYCGNDKVPLTVDHVVLWEMMGPSIEENLISACKKCNKKRGNMLYGNWLDSDYYKRVSSNLTELTRILNRQVLEVIDRVPLRVNKRSR